MEANYELSMHIVELSRICIAPAADASRSELHEARIIRCTHLAAARETSMVHKRVFRLVLGHFEINSERMNSAREERKSERGRPPLGFKGSPEQHVVCTRPKALRRLCILVYQCSELRLFAATSSAELRLQFRSFAKQRCEK